MKGQYDSAVDPRDLTKRLHHIQKSHSISNDGDRKSSPPPPSTNPHSHSPLDISRLPRLSRPGTSSSSPTTSPTMSHQPTFTKTPTMSTTASSDSHVSRLRYMGVRSGPSSRECKASAEVGRGEFSKPRARSARRRESNDAKSVPEFQYYGRHANTWLFNDFSVTESVKKGWGKVFSGKGE